MTHQEYTALLNKYEIEKSANLEQFKESVSRFIMLGFIFFAGITLFFSSIIAISVGLIFAGHVNRVLIYLIIAGGIGMYPVLKMLFLKYHEPEGEILSIHQAPKLFERIEEISNQIGSPKISAVRLIEELNATASAYPKFFLFGKPALHVAIGVPLMANLNRDEMDSVLAHELAHHTNRDTDVSLKVYRVMGVWSMLAEQEGTWIDWSPYFARWYYPRISAMSEVLSRDMEFAADGLAGKVVGNEVAARSLMRLTFASRLRTKALNKYLIKATEEHELPIPNPIQVMLDIAEEPISVDRKLLEAEARRTSSIGDSHPSLAERTANLGFPLDLESEHIVAWHSQMEAPLAETALDYYLGGSDSVLSKKLNDEWCKQNESKWIHTRGIRDMAKAIVAEYESRTVPLLPREKTDYAFYLGISGKKDEAVQFLEKSHLESPNDPQILRGFALSAITLDDPRTEELLSKLYEVPSFRFEADEYRYSWLQDQGRTEEAESIAEKLRESSKAWEETVESIMPWKDWTVVTHMPMTNVYREKILSILKKHKQIESAYYARAEHPSLEGLNRSILFIAINMGPIYADEESQFYKLTHALFDELELWLTADVRILPTKSADAKKAMSKMAEFKIYP